MHSGYLIMTSLKVYCFICNIEPLHLHRYKILKHQVHLFVGTSQRATIEQAIRGLNSELSGCVTLK